MCKLHYRVNIFAELLNFSPNVIKDKFYCWITAYGCSFSTISVNKLVLQKFSFASLLIVIFCALFVMKRFLQFIMEDHLCKPAFNLAI